MWTCPECGRIFKRRGQQHSCRKIPLEQHFKNKEHTQELFDYLLEQIDSKVGKCQVISIPCCVHLFGKYDFLAALPKKDWLEIRFALDQELKSPRVKQTVPMSKKVFKNCLDVYSKDEIDDQLMGWLRESYYLKD